MQSHQKTKEELIEEFLKKMTDQGFVSALTGYIFLDPIHVGEKSTEVFERQFIEECARTSGKNPITREPLDLNIIQKIPSLMEMQDQIEDEIKQFLEKNKNHPEIKEIEKAIQAERYVNKQMTTSQAQPQPAQPTDPTADDLVAMGINPNQAIPATGLGQGLALFQQAPPPVQWNIVVDYWQLYNSGAEINRHKRYDNNNPSHIRKISLYGILMVPTALHCRQDIWVEIFVSMRRSLLELKSIPLNIISN